MGKNKSDGKDSGNITFSANVEHWGETIYSVKLFGDKVIAFSELHPTIVEGSKHYYDDWGNGYVWDEGQKRMILVHKANE